MEVKAGSTSVILGDVFIQDTSVTTGAGLTGLTSGSSGLTCYYHRNTASSAVAVTLVSMTLGTFTSGGFLAVDGTNAPGVYSFCPPDAALAAGAQSVTFFFKGATNMAARPYTIDLIAVDKQDTVRMGLTALPNAAANATGGLPAAVIRGGTAQAGAASTITLDSGASSTDNIYRDLLVWIVSGTGAGQCAAIQSYAGSTKVATIFPSWATNPDNTSVFVLLPASQVDVGNWLNSTISTPSTAGVPRTDLYLWRGSAPLGLSSSQVQAVVPDTQKVDVNTIKAQSVTCAAGVTVLDYVGTAAVSTAQTGDAYADTQTLTGRVTASRAGYWDNLNVGGVVASQADVLALNQSASRRIVAITVGQYERPESGGVDYTIEVRTYDDDGAAVNADADPTVTATGSLSGSLNSQLSSAANPATGVYRFSYTVLYTATSEQIRFDVSAAISASTFTLSCYTQVVDEVSQTWTSTDASHLTTIFNALPTGGLYIAGSGTANGDVYSAIGSVTTAIAGLNDIAITDIVTGGAIATTGGKINEVILVDTTAVNSDMITGADIRTAVGLGSANLDSQLSALSSGVADKTGYKLAADGLDSLTTTAPTGFASTVKEMIVQLHRRFFAKSTLTATQLKTLANDGTTVLTTQTLSDDGTTQTVTKAV